METSVLKIATTRMLHQICNITIKVTKEKRIQYKSTQDAYESYLEVVITSYSAFLSPCICTNL